jgi:hypothetical protein
MFEANFELFKYEHVKKLKKIKPMETGKNEKYSHDWENPRSFLLFEVFLSS